MHSPDIFIVHGALGCADQMERVADALSALGIVQVVELPGHGSTPLRDGERFDFDAFTGALSSAIERRAKSVREEVMRLHARVDPPLPIVFGYSMGGYAVLALEAKHPSSFGGIVTLGTKFAWTPEYADREKSRLDAAAIAEKVPKYAMQLEERHAACGGWHSVLDNTAMMLTRLGTTPLLTREVLAHVRVPVCLAVGDLDDMVTIDETRETASWLSNGTAVVLPGVPHPIDRVPVDRVVELVRNFTNM